MDAQATTTAIAALSVTGLMIKARGSVKDILLDRDCPIFFPRPNEFVTGYSEEPLSAGTAGTAFKEVDFILSYYFFYCAIGKGRNLQEKESAAETLLELLFTTLRAADTALGLTWVQPSNISGWTTYTDKKEENTFYGCEVGISCQQHINK